MQVTFEQSPGAMVSAVHTVLIRGGCFIGNVRVITSVVHTAVWAYRLPTEWTGLIKCGGGTSPASGMDRAQ
jgi:hypothetical protein